MVTAICILSVLVLFMLAGALPTPGGMQSAVFRSPVFALLLGALAVSLAVCLWRRRPTWRSFGFHLTHLAVVVILVGAFLGFTLGKRTRFRLPVALLHEVRELPMPDGGWLEPGFGLSVTHFSVSYYDPDRCTLYRPATTEDGQLVLEPVREIPLPAEGPLDLGEAGSLEVAALKDESGEWIPRHMLDNGWVLVPALVPRHFRAALRITGEDGAVTREELAVNHPVDHARWRFYLMDYDKRGGQYVVLSARRDPGRAVAIAGLWALMLGVSLMCFRRTGGDDGTA